jgi:uncharacterized protein with PhoU and TrkA domain
MRTLPTQVHECECPACLASKENPEWRIHHHMNLLASRLDEQQRRWYVAIESQRIGHGGDTLLSQITGIDVETIRRGRSEIDEELTNRPEERVREAGGGRPTVEKKTHRSRKH